MCIGFSTKKLILVGPKKIVEKELGQGCTRALVVLFNWNGVPIAAPWDVRIVISARRAHGQLIILRRRQQTFFHRDKEDSSDSDDGGSGASRLIYFPGKQFNFHQGNLVYRMPNTLLLMAFQPIPLFLLLGVKEPNNLGRNAAKYQIVMIVQWKQYACSGSGTLERRCMIWCSFCSSNQVSQVKLLLVWCWKGL